MLVTSTGQYLFAGTYPYVSLCSIISDCNAFGMDESLPTNTATGHWLPIVNSLAFAVQSFPNRLTTMEGNGVILYVSTQFLK